ncbi:MAG: chitobiase/beta-hexosaminidase C-terminal domain-containing protein [Chthoniobacterales bacterium]
MKNPPLFTFPDIVIPFKKYLVVFSLLMGLMSSVLAVNTPQLVPASGDFTKPVSVVVSSTTPKAILRYTTNGQEPTEKDSPVENGGTIRVGSNVTLKVRAWDEGNTASSVSMGVYRITGMVAAGATQALAIKGDGQVQAWGAQLYGQLANGGLAAASVKVPIDAQKSAAEKLGNIVAADGGDGHTILLDNSGTVWTTGLNTSGQLGDSTAINKNFPTKVMTATTPLGNVVSVSAGKNFSVAADAEGNVWSWGLEADGRLGNGSNATATRKVADKVTTALTETPVLTGVKQVSAGERFAVARKSDGSVWTWGSNATGQLGNGGKTSKNSAVPVLATPGGAPLTGVADVAAGDEHVVAALGNGSVYTWGNQEAGRLGNGETEARAVSKPVPVMLKEGAPLIGIKQVAAAGHYSLALDLSGHVWSWGENGKGQLGIGNTTDQASPNEVKLADGSTLDRVVYIAAGGSGTSGFGMALRDDGSVYLWGNNTNGELGNGEKGSQAFATQSSGPTIAGTAGAVAIAPVAPGISSLTGDGAAPMAPSPTPTPPPNGTITSGGVGYVSIGHSANATVQTKDMATQLQIYIQQMSGVLLPIITNATATTTNVILVGTFDNAGYRDGTTPGNFPTLPLSAQLPTDTNMTYKEGIYISTAIVGGGTQVRVIGKTEYGVPRAVFKFLEFFGYRMFMPSTEWEIVPSVPNIWFGNVTINERPVMAHREISPGSVLHEITDDKLQYPGYSGVRHQQDLDKWYKRNLTQDSTRTQCASNSAIVQNGFGVYPNTAWFNAGGSDTYGPVRLGYHPSELRKTPELSRPEVMQKLGDWAVSEMTAPSPVANRDAVPMDPIDGMLSPVSQRPAAGAPYIGDGTVTDQILYINNKVGEKLRSVPATANKMTGYQIYGRYIALPSQQVLGQLGGIDPAVIGAFMWTHNYPTGQWETMTDYINAWKAIPLTTGGTFSNIQARGNWAFFHQDYDQLPGSGLEASVLQDSVSLQTELQAMAAVGVKGFLCDVEDNWGTNGISYNLLARLMWNPNASTTSIKQDFYQKAFGAGWINARRFYDCIDPKGTDVLFGRETMSLLLNNLNACATDVAGDPASTLRVNRLKEWMYYQYLVWKLQRTDLIPANQTAIHDLCYKILNLCYRERWSHIMYYEEARQTLAVQAKNVLSAMGENPNDWDPNTLNGSGNPTSIWRYNPSSTTLTPPATATEINTMFQEARTYFPVVTAPTQQTYSNDLVSVTVPQPLNATNWSNVPTLVTAGKHGKVSTFALHSFNGITASVKIRTNTDATGVTTPIGPTGTLLTLRDMAGFVINTQSVPADWQVRTINFTVGTAGSPHKGTYYLTVDDHGCGTQLQATAFDLPLAACMDKKFRTGGLVTSNNVYFYVPAGTTSFKYHFSPATLDGPLGAHNPPHHIHDPLDDALLISVNGSTDIKSFQEVITVQVPAGRAGKVWHMDFGGAGYGFGQLWFYNLPPYMTSCWQSIMVPRNIATADGLTIRTN